MAERHRQRHASERAQGVGAADELRLDARGAGALSRPTPRIAVPLDLDARLIAAFDPATIVVRLSGETMGTVWRVAVAAPRAFDPGPLYAAIVGRLGGLVREMSHWEAGSPLSRFNRAAAGTWVTLPHDFARVAGAAFDVAERTGGAFDPAIGALVDAWGFGPVRRDGAPSDGEVAAAFAASGYRRLAFERAARRLRQPGGVALDLSGIAKGYAVDAVADLLGARGHAHALVEIGGECAGRGIRPDGDPWWIDLETPPGVELPPLRVALHEFAVATSGDYVRGRHTIDPRTGRQAVGVVAVSVLHRLAMVADAWASALTVLGSEGRAPAERERLACRIVTEDGGEWLSPALLAML